ESYERIHRSILVMRGVLPLVFEKGQSAEKLGLDGTEAISVDIDESVMPNTVVPVTAVNADGKETKFNAVALFDSDVEMDYYRNGGILQLVLRERMKQAYMTNIKYDNNSYDM